MYFITVSFVQPPRGSHYRNDFDDFELSTAFMFSNL